LIHGTSWNGVTLLDCFRAQEKREHFLLPIPICFFLFRNWTIPPLTKNTVSYVLVFAPGGTSLEEMVAAFGARWTVEQCFEEGKGDVGLDEYEVRSWHGWYRHTTLSMLALAFLATLRANGGEGTRKKSLNRYSRHRGQMQLIQFNHKCLLTSQLWFPSVLPKFDGFSLVS
jgi:hypothetical protein